jgi:hypothetical protein
MIFLMPLSASATSDANRIIEDDPIERRFDVAQRPLAVGDGGERGGVGLAEEDQPAAAKAVVASRSLDVGTAVERGKIGLRRRMVEADANDIDVGLDAIRRDRAAAVAVGVHRRTRRA